MNAITWPGIVTLLNVVLLSALAALVAKARVRYGVKAPATTGDPAFERAFRVQMNTLENTVAFLPALWLAALTNPGLVAPAAGAVWLAGRVLYAQAYLKDPASRSGGFSISLLALVVLIIYAAIGLLRPLLTAAA